MNGGLKPSDPVPLIYGRKHARLPMFKTFLIQDSTLTLNFFLGDDMKFSVFCTAAVAAGLLAGCGGDVQVAQQDAAAKPPLWGPNFTNLPANTSPKSNGSNSYTQAEEVGQTFTAYVGARKNGATVSDQGVTSFEMVQVKIISPTSIQVTNGDGEIQNYVRTGQPTDGANFQKSQYFNSVGKETISLFRFPVNGTLPYTEPFVGVMTGTRSDPKDDGFLAFNFGFVTDPATLPTATATYTGSADLFIAKQGDQNVWHEGFRAPTVLNADFAANTISGTIFDNTSDTTPEGDRTAVVTLNSGSIDRLTSGISSSDLSIAVTDAATSASPSAINVSQTSGNLLGQFTGDAAKRAHGAFGGTFVGADAAGAKNYSFSGTFNTVR